MLSVEATFANKTGTFPNALAINSTGPSDTNGTEFIADMINNWMFGPSQFLLNKANLTPDEVLESGSASQIFEAMRNSYSGVPAGTIVQYPLNDTPSNLGHNCLLLAGQAVLVSAYPDLAANVYVGDANNAAVFAGGGAFYRCDNSDGSSPNTAGNYIKLPDTRGRVPRGYDSGATVDPDGASRFLGDVQADSFQGHRFWTGILANSTAAGLTHIYGTTTSECPGVATGNMSAGAGVGTHQPLSSLPKDDGTNGTPRTSSETRMANFSTQYAIVY